ncbi:MAG TPA: hypothetical protein VIY29_10985 [Ktedonobacteraceae bacterium]
MKLARLKVLVGLREHWQEQVSQVRQMYAWLLQAEHILSGEWATPEEILTNEHVARRFDAWIAQLTQLAASQVLPEKVQECLLHFLKITQGLRPHLIQCYDLEGFPRTNNDMEGYIRSLKTRYRRVSGRKNWNSYLLRYGRCIAYYDWLERAGISSAEIAHMLQGVGHQEWRAMRARYRHEQLEQLKIYRFRHRREHYLSELEARWEKTAIGTGSLH